MTSFQDLRRSLLVIGIALIAGLLLVVLMSEEPINSARSFFLSVFSDRFYFGNLISNAIPLILTGLAASIAFSSSSFNLGIEG